MLPTAQPARLKFVIAAISMAAILLGLVAVWLFSPVSSGSVAEVQFTVVAGQGTAAIARDLKEAGLVRSAQAFAISVHLHGYTTTLKAGTYVLSPGMTPAEIAAIIAGGKGLSDDVTVTIPEGMNVWEIDDLLQARHLIVPGSFARQWQPGEGTLFPDTYRLPHALASASTEFATADAIGAVFHAAAVEKTRGYNRQQVILASILEKEAKTPADMALVAGIMERRMAIGMPLQVDATVGYGWCLARWLPMSSTANCDVTQAPIALAIKNDGPYNSYTRKGLPAGPISNPGLTALNAAAHPTASDYLYYLSTRDGSQLIYAKTLAEHEANRAKYLGL